MMTDKQPTICVKCVNMMLGTPKYPNTPQCKVSPMTNYVTGESEFTSCSTVNKGECPDYAAAPVPPDPQAEEAWGSSEGDKEIINDTP